MEPTLKKASKSNSRKKNRLDMNISSGPERKVMFGCEICGKILANKTTLAQHIKIHEGKKPFRCDICDYSCFRNSTMNRHIVSVHEGRKQFNCDICEYSCSLKHNLKSHVAFVHEGKKPFKCGICEYTCSLNQQLKQHVTKKHGETNFHQ